MGKLLPCPICGRLPKLSSLEPEHQSMKYFCGTHVSCGDWKENEESAADDWNRRTTDKFQPDLYKPTNGDVILNTLKNVECLAEFLWDGYDESVPEFSTKQELIDWLNEPKI